MERRKITITRVEIFFGIIHRRFDFLSFHSLPQHFNITLFYHTTRRHGSSRNAEGICQILECQHSGGVGWTQWKSYSKTRNWTENNIDGLRTETIHYPIPEFFDPQDMRFKLFDAGKTSDRIQNCQTHPIASPMHFGSKPQTVVPRCDR
uniref:Uncharacterized protein n=1 Tax=Rodentolepis nana TaxID=102285 RepID=A0A0R3TF11_RODNA